MTLEQEYNKLLSRRDELQKQEVTLRREYTTLLRKIASITAVLETLDDNTENFSQLPSDNALSKVQELHGIVETLESIDRIPLDQVEIPEKLIHSYELFKNTPLLYKDSPNYV